MAVARKKQCDTDDMGTVRKMPMPREKEKQSQQKSGSPKLSPRPVPVPVDASDRPVEILKKSGTETSLPVLRTRKQKPAHQRQNSEPMVRRPLARPDRHRSEESTVPVAMFDAALDDGKMHVRLESGSQYRRFLAWAVGKHIRSLVLNDSLWGLERDMKALLSMRPVEKVRQQYRDAPGVADVLQALPGLRSLDISRCDPSEPELLALFHMLRKPGSQLISLQADGLYWGGQEVVRSLITGIAGSMRLTHLSMTGATGEALTPHVLLKALRTNTTLETLHFSRTDAQGAVDPEDIATTIFVNSTLKDLRLTSGKFISAAENLFGDEEPVAFKLNELTLYHWMAAFIKNTTLESLSILGAPLPPSMIDAIADSLSDRSAIRAIRLVESDENKVALQRLQRVIDARRPAREASTMV